MAKYNITFDDLERQINVLPDRENLYNDKFRRWVDMKKNWGRVTGEEINNLEKEVDKELEGKAYKVDFRIRGIEQCHICKIIYCKGWTDLYNSKHTSKRRLSYGEIHELKEHPTSDRLETIRILERFIS